jgi:hypothetical protein
MAMFDPLPRELFLKHTSIILNSAVAGLKMAHLLEITSAFEFAVLTLTVPGLRLRKYQNPLCFRVSAPFSSSLTAEFRIITTHSCRESGS